MWLGRGLAASGSAACRQQARAQGKRQRGRGQGQEQPAALLVGRQPPPPVLGIALGVPARVTFQIAPVCARYRYGGFLSMSISTMP